MNKRAQRAEDQYIIRHLVVRLIKSNHAINNLIDYLEEAQEITADCTHPTLTVAVNHRIRGILQDIKEIRSNLDIAQGTACYFWEDPQQTLPLDLDQ